MQILLQTTCKKLKGTARPTKNEQVKRMYGLSTREIAMHNRFKFILKAESFYNVKFGLSITTSKVSKKNLSNENTGVFVVFKTKRKLKCQNELFL